MDPVLLGVIKIAGDLGLVALVIYMWWTDNGRIWTIVDLHRKDMASVLDQYKKDMSEQREMYRANVSLCRDFSSVASDLRDIVSLNIQKMTQVDDAIRQNQFCPMVRIDRVKKILGVEKES